MITVDADLYSGSKIVGHVKKGEFYKVASIYEKWASLAELDGSPLHGWILLKYLKVSQPD